MLFYPDRRTRLSLFIKGLMSAALIYGAEAYANAGSIRLSITDTQTQRPISNASITVIPRSGSSLEVAANHQGIAYIAELEAGLYTLVINHPEYQKVRLARVRVLDNKTTPVETKLRASENILEEMLVLGSASARSPSQPAGTSLIDRESLNSAAGSGSDVLRSLDGLPGLFGDGEYSSFTVRGNGPRDNLILVDGIPFENLVHFSDSFGSQEEVEGGGRYSVFAPNTIGSAEFQPGGWDPTYGGKAGSLLKLDVAEGNPDTASYRTRVDIAGLEVGYDGPALIHDKTSILFSARDYNFGRLFDIIGIDDVGTPKLTDIIFKSTTEASDKDRINFLAIHAPEEFERNIENVLATDEDKSGDFGDSELISAETDNSLLAATWIRLIGDNAELTNQIYFRDYHETATTGEAYPDLSPLGTPANQISARKNILASEREERETGLQSDFQTNNNLGRFSTGIQITQTDLAFRLTLDDDWIRYTFDQNDYRPTAKQKYILLTPETINNHYTQKETNYATYLNQEVDLDFWNFRVGARYERDNFSDENLFSPRAAATWPINNQLRLTTTIGRYYQAPRFNDRASDATNSNLENERIDQFSLGLHYRINPNLEFFIEPYYQDLDHLIVQKDGVNQTFGNTGQGKSWGIDTALTRQFDNGWSANINYSYNQARIQDNPTSTEYDADFNRPHIFSIGGVWEINQRWKLSSRWKWASGKPKDVYSIHDNVLGNNQPLRYSRETIETNTERFDSYNSLNFRADYIRSFGRTNVIAFIDVINVLGADNPATTDFIERTGKEEIEEGEALPIIGLMFEW